jgi:putative endonuclease
MRSQLKPSQGAPAGARQGQAPGKPTTKQTGDAGEDQALRHLTRAGLQLVVRHYRTPGRGGGEIDLIMREADGTLVFVEVRSRALGRFGGAAVTVGPTKQRRILLAARHYLMRWRTWPACRFDVVAIDGADITWLKAAFEAGA